MGLCNISSFSSATNSSYIRDKRKKGSLALGDAIRTWIQIFAEAAAHLVQEGERDSSPAPPWPKPSFKLYAKSYARTMSWLFMLISIMLHYFDRRITAMPLPCIYNQDLDQMMIKWNNYWSLDFYDPPATVSSRRDGSMLLGRIPFVNLTTIDCKNFFENFDWNTISIDR